MRDSDLLFQARGDFVDDERRDTAIIDRDEESRSFFVAADGQRLGPKPLLDAFRFGLADRVTRQADRVSGRDVEGGSANLNRAVRSAKSSEIEAERDKDDQAERSSEHIAIVGERKRLSSFRRFSVTGAHSRFGRTGYVLVHPSHEPWLRKEFRLQAAGAVWTG